MANPEPRREPKSRPSLKTEVDDSRLLAGLWRSPRERLDQAIRMAQVMERFRRAKRLGPVVPR
ncbi:MAG: hypothetical protein QOF51_3700 [Chloroflexota bacterium]|jgi:hypothetical protein|nr:hypothetical protein [Chloroflexota bacterium]